MRWRGGGKALSRAVAESVSISAALLRAKRLRSRAEQETQKLNPEICNLLRGHRDLGRMVDAADRGIYGDGSRGHRRCRRNLNCERIAYHCGAACTP